MRNFGLSGRKNITVVYWGIYIVGAVMVCLWLRYLMVTPANRSIPAGATSILEFTTVSEYATYLKEQGWSLERMRQDGIVPLIYSENLPNDLLELPVKEKTSLFISLLLPEIIRVNEEISRVRQEVISLLNKKESHSRLDSKQQWRLNRLARKYGAQYFDDKELLTRIDTIPVSLAMAQAITESGWGTSRFARMGNALYGQHFSSSRGGKFILSKYGNVKVAAFDSLYGGTHSYIHTLNSVGAYKKLRTLRSKLRDNGKQPSGQLLATGLGSYSEMGQEYVEDLQYLIKKYRLDQLDELQLQRGSSAITVKFSR